MSWKPKTFYDKVEVLKKVGKFEELTSGSGSNRVGRGGYFDGGFEIPGLGKYTYSGRCYVTKLDKGVVDIDFIKFKHVMNGGGEGLRGGERVGSDVGYRHVKEMLKALN